MIEFNKCIVDPKGKKLIIEASVKDSEYFENVFIDSVIIDTEETFSPSGPSSNPIATFNYVVEAPVEPETTTLEEPTVEERTPQLTTMARSKPVAPPTLLTMAQEPEEDEVETITETELKSTTKNVTIELTPKMFGLETFNDRLFFVYVKTTGSPSPMTPCGQDNATTMAVALNYEPIYNLALGYIREIEQSCQTPKGFIDMILRYKALQLALKAGNYPLAVEFWNKLFKGKTDSVAGGTNICNCNGVY